MFSVHRLLSFLFLALIYVSSANAAALSDSPHDADIGQSSYVGGDHNLDPIIVSQFTHLWNATFQPNEKVKLKFLMLM
jgi:hypothetical protein